MVAFSIEWSCPEQLWPDEDISFLFLMTLFTPLVGRAPILFDLEKVWAAVVEVPKVALD